MLDDLTRRLEWAKRRVDLPSRAVRDPAAARPPWPTCSIYLYWSAGAKDALDGRTVFSKPGGGTRVGERLSGLPLTLRSDPAPAAPGLSCAPFVIAHASTRQSSVFDNGLRAPADRLDLRRRARWPLDPDPAFGRAVRARRSPRRSGTCML